MSRECQLGEDQGDGKALAKTLPVFGLMCQFSLYLQRRTIFLLATFSISVLKYLNKSNLRDKKFILAHSMLRKSWLQVLEADNHIHRQEPWSDECWFATCCHLYLHSRTFHLKVGKGHMCSKEDSWVEWETRKKGDGDAIIFHLKQ